MFKIWNRIFLNSHFFIYLFVIAIAFIFSFVYKPLFSIVQLLVLLLIGLTIADLILLASKRNGITGTREMAEMLSNSDENPVEIQLKSSYFFKVFIRVLEELPDQFQKHKLKFNIKIFGGKTSKIKYNIRPTERGEYQFYNTNVLVNSPLRLITYRYVLKTNKKVKVYPAFMQLKQYNLKSLLSQINDLGNKKNRKIGHSLEFEQIKEYVRGDDIRTINWKATAKHQKFMVNQYITEKSQQVYCVIDKGRAMRMPFNELSLLDYAINASLVTSNIVLQNHDRVGIFTFSKKVENQLKAEQRNHQMQKILETLYNVKTDFLESDFGNLYGSMKSLVTQRSLILLFTNFESMDSMHRQLPYLKAINRTHVLIPIFFRNTELEDFAFSKVEYSKDVFEKSVAEKFIYEKRLIVKELAKHGIQSILTKPEDLNINVLNKYLEVKAKAIL